MQPKIKLNNNAIANCTKLTSDIIAYMSVLWFINFMLDDTTCDTICDHHCVRQRTGQTRCVCDQGYYLAQDGITCIGNVTFIG